MSTLARLYAKRVMGVERQACRAFYTKSTDRVLSDEERALENVYIQKMERERLEKLRKKLAKENTSGIIKTEASAEKTSAEGAEHRHATG